MKIGFRHWNSNNDFFGDMGTLDIFGIGCSKDFENHIFNIPFKHHFYFSIMVWNHDFILDIFWKKKTEIRRKSKNEKRYSKD